jgi:hypothetical protein
MIKVLIQSLVLVGACGLQQPTKTTTTKTTTLLSPSDDSRLPGTATSRREALTSFFVNSATATAAAATLVCIVEGPQQPAWGASAVQDSLDVEDFLRRGVDGGGNMGVSSQAGKTKPVTGVYLR